MQPVVRSIHIEETESIEKAKNREEKVYDAYDDKRLRACSSTLDTDNEQNDTDHEMSDIVKSIHSEISSL